MTIGFYSDSHCSQNEIIKDFQGTEDGGVHCAVCTYNAVPIPAGIQDDTVYAKVLGGGVVVQATILNNAQCDNSGPPAPIGELVGGKDTCLQLKGVQDDWSIAIWGLGGADDGPVCKRDVNTAFSKRGGSCASFEEHRVERTETSGQPVSDIVDCTGQNQACPITKSTTDSVTWDVSMSFDGGGGPTGMSLGKSVTHSVSITEGWSVPAGQRGRMYAYADALTHIGVWKDCDGNDVPGNWLEPLDSASEREVNVA